MNRLRAPQTHWRLLLVVLGSLLAALLLHGATVGSGTGTRSSAPGQAVGVPGRQAIAYAGPQGLTSRSLPGRTVALTFDDGPDPTWTPQVLDVLAREQVPATFFAVGGAIRRHGGLVRRELDQGHEVGIHTWTHAELAALPAWHARLELSLTQLALTAATGRTSALLRPPYSSTAAAVTPRELAPLRRAVADGYLVALSDLDGQDWRRPGVPAVVDHAAPPADGRGVVVLLHDGGGDRRQTVAALPVLIDRYRAAGYRFTTVSEGLGLAPQASDPQAGWFARAEGLVTMQAIGWSDRLLTVLGWLVVALTSLMLLRTVLVLLLSGRHVRVARARVAGLSWTPGVTVLVPAYNESVGIAATVRSLAASDYAGPLEVIVIDDGSDDGTADIVEALAQPGVRVIRQANAGKAEALAYGTQQAQHDVLVMLDGDTVFEPGTVGALVQPLQDSRVGAVSGNTKVGNRSGLLGRWQHLEYVMGFNLDRRMLDLLGCIPTVPGASGAFSRAALLAAGGLSSDTLAEDTDITMAITRAGYRVVYEETARAWTEAPGSVRDLWKQRYRWAYGTLQCVWKHRGAVRDRSALGLFGIPYMLTMQVLLAVLSPLVDVLALYELVLGRPGPVVTAWLAFQLLGLLSAVRALRLDGESLRPLWALPLQQLLYRQLMYLVVIQSVVAALSGIRLPWHKLERRGMQSATATPA